MYRDKFDKFFKSSSTLFNILSNSDRIKILSLLIKQEMDVNEIHEKLKISQSRTSQHLKLLKLNNLVEEHREGKHVYYKVKNPNILKVIETALQFQMLTITSEPELLKSLNELLLLLKL